MHEIPDSANPSQARDLRPRIHLRMHPCRSANRRTSGRQPGPLLAIGAALSIAAWTGVGAEEAGSPSTDESNPPEVSSPRSDTSAALPSGIMFRINGKDIPRRRFLEELNDALGESYRDTFIAHVLIDERARELAVNVSPAEIDERIRETVERVRRESFGGNASQMEEALRDRGLTLDGWKKRLAIDVRYDLLLDKMLLRDRSISEETLHRLFEEEYGPSGVKINIRHIQKNVPVAASPEYTLEQFEKDRPKIEEEARARAEEALAKIRGGESFESVMEAYSDDPRKATGGALNMWKGRYGTELDEAASTLEEGEVSGVTKGPDGFRIVRCTEVSNVEEVHARHILIATGSRSRSGSDEQARAKAEDLVRQIRAGAGFESLAKDHSDDPGSAPRGGDLGFFPRDAMVQPFADAAFALEPGQVSDVVQTSFGFHIIKVEGKRVSQERALQQILISTQFVMVKDRKIRPALEARALDGLEPLREKIVAGEISFADAATEHTEDASTKSAGGLIAGYRVGMFGGTFDEAVTGLAPGDPPRVVKDAAGHLHLVVVEEIVKTGYEQVKESIRAKEKQRAPTPQEKSDYVNSLRERATIIS